MTVASRSLFNILFRTFSKLNTRHQLSILKFIKNMSSLPDILLLLQNANAIERLTEILAGTTKTAYFKDYANQILHTMYNMCRLSNDRQEEAAIAGIIPVLQETISADLPLKEFALSVFFAIWLTQEKLVVKSFGNTMVLKLTSISRVISTGRLRRTRPLLLGCKKSLPRSRSICRRKRALNSCSRVWRRQPVPCLSTVFWSLCRELCAPVPLFVVCWQASLCLNLSIKILRLNGRCLD